jgi:hypothetical protein
MTIYEIYNNGNLSIRSYHACINNGIDNLSDLQEYLIINKSFMRFKNCGRKSNEELIEICNESHLNQNFRTLNKSNLKKTIDEIYNKEKISARTYNVCKSNKLNSIEDLIDFFQRGTHKKQSQPFLYLKNCGKKSNEELINICYQYNENQDFEILNESNNKITISELTRVQREVINNFILVNTNYLSVRSKNAVRLILEGNFKIKNFAQKILFSETFNVKNIKNIGARCIPELKIYFLLVSDFLLDVSKSNDEKYLISLKNKFLIQRTFSISKIPSIILESESIFLLTDFLLNQNALFDKTQTIIVKKAFKIHENNTRLTLDDIADKVTLTRERVRQIRNTCLDELFNKLSFIKNLSNDLLQKYNIDIDSNQIEINSETIERINNTENTNLSKEFIIYLLYVYVSERFSLIGNVEDVLLHKHITARNRYNWNNFFIVDKEIVREIDFNALVNDINSRLNDRIEESYSFNFKSYLSKFLTNNNIYILDLALPIAEKIINDEFEFYLDLNENLIFKRNTIKKVPEYIIEALENLGEPSKLNTIYNWIEKKYPLATKSEKALRGSCNRSNEIIYFGRSSTFGLKKWENSRDDIKGGTIKNIVTDLLEESKNPIHIIEILNKIHQYREQTNERNVITNLKLDPNNNFIFFNQKFIGLRSKINSYDREKYKGLPIQLGKKIKGLIIKKNIINQEEMLSYLKINYVLTTKESLNILTSLNIIL